MAAASAQAAALSAEQAKGEKPFSCRVGFLLKKSAGKKIWGERNGCVRWEMRVLGTILCQLTRVLAPGARDSEAEFLGLLWFRSVK